ncbi:hypothetical protein ACWD8L_15025 [Streptomyces sp. NPDC005133]
MKVCFLFNEDWRDGEAWGWPVMKEELLRSFVASTPLHRRHARFSFGTIPFRDLSQRAGAIEAAVEAILGENWAVWSTFTGPDLCESVSQLDIAGMVVDSIAPADARAMHVLLKPCGGYLGAIQIVSVLPSHWLAFEAPIPCTLRVFQNELFVLYRGFELEVSDERDHSVISDWRDSGIFDSVEWEDSGVRETIFDPYLTREHSRRVGELEHLLTGQLASTVSEVLIRCSDIDPNLTTRLHGALKAFEEHDSVEQLAHVSLSCRRFIETLADALYPPRKGKVNGRDVGKAQYRNRLWAYINEKIDSRTARELVLANFADLGNRIDALDTSANKGLHAENTTSEINRLLLTLLVVSHELLTLNPPGGEFSFAPYKEEISKIAKKMFQEGEC